MSKAQTSAVRVSANMRNPGVERQRHTPLEAELSERWNSRLDGARQVVAAQIVASLKSKWGTAVALEAETGICRTEMSRIRHGKLARFSLERLVRILWIVDPDVDLELRVRVVPKSDAVQDSESQMLG